MDESKKRKEHPGNEEFQGSDFKKMRLSVFAKKYEEEKNLLDERINCLKQFTSFPEIVDIYTRVPWQPLDPNYIEKTEEFKKFLGMSQFGKNHIVIFETGNTGDSHYYKDYSTRRGDIACALLAGADISLVTLNFFNHTITISDYWLIYVMMMCGFDVEQYRKIDRRSPLRHATTIEMAELLLSVGDNHFLLELDRYEGRDLFEECIEKLNWKLLEFYGSRGGKMPPSFGSCHGILINKWSDSCIDKMEDFLKTLKVIFILGYHEVDEEAQDLDARIDGAPNSRKQVLKSQKSVIAKVLVNPYFSVDVCLYTLFPNKPHVVWNEQNAMYTFGITGNQPDLSINYL